MRQLTISKQITNREGDSINRYFQEVSKYPLISPEEEVELTIRIREGEQKALEKMVLANLRFVISVAKQYQNQGLSFSDLINEGNMGLVKAAKKFDETRGFKFISYAVWWIRQGIIVAISEQTRVVRLPLNRLTSINRIKKVLPYLEQELEREPTVKEIADFIDFTTNDVEIAKNIQRNHMSFDKPFQNGNDGEFNLYDIIENDDIAEPDAGLIEESLRINLLRALNKLSIREKSIIIMYYGLNGQPLHTLEEIAGKYGMSSERVRQIRKKGLHKLRDLLDGYNTLIKD